jgi:phosphopantothenoylcysteine decarboxylase/phosphopantothenate--cysteine ligase
MADQMQTLLPSADIIVMAAAVADFAPKQYQPQKIKKSDEMTVELVRTQDILAALGRQKGPKQIIMGFAAETENLEANAKAKLVSKNLDVIALNDVSIPGEGFGSDKNNIILFFSDGKKADLGSEEKTVLASQIVGILFELYRSNHAK